MKGKIFLLICLYLVMVFGVGYMAGVNLGATNFGRIVLGDDNIGEDPNPTADITGQNDEYISNYTNGTWNMGDANLTFTGDLLTPDSVSARTLKLGDSLWVGKGAKITGLLTQTGIIDYAWAGKDTMFGVEDSIKITGISANDFVLLHFHYVSGVKYDTIAAIQYTTATNKITLARSSASNGDVPYSYVIFR